jgi:hypothetical protein
LLVVLNSVSVVRGELIASEDFHYNRTLTSGAEGGRGWADAWSGVNFITVGSLPFAGLKNDGHKLTVNGAQSGSDSVKCSFRAISADGHEGLDWFSREQPCGPQQRLRRHFVIR